MATVITKVKILLDEHQEPFIPFVTTDAVFKNGTDERLTEYIDNYLDEKTEEFNEVKTNTEQAVATLISDTETTVNDFMTDRGEDVDDLISDTQAAANAIIANLEYMRDHGDFIGPQGPQGIQGEKGDTGDSGVYYGPDEPTNPDIGIWIDTADPVALAIAEESDF